MKLSKLSAIMMITLLFVNQTPVHAQSDSIENLSRDTATKVTEGAAQEIFDALAEAAGPACDMYALGVDLVNFFYDGQWKFYDPLVEISVLFRNQSWRELIWAISDQRDAFVKEITVLKKRKCVLAFASAEAMAEGGLETKEKQVGNIDKQISELQAKIDFFGVQRDAMRLERPEFFGIEMEGEKAVVNRILETDKVFYWLLSSPTMNWDQLARDSVDIWERTKTDLRVVFDNLPEACFASVNIIKELGSYLTFQFKVENGVYTDLQGNTYASYQEFLQSNARPFSDDFAANYCSDPASRELPSSNPIDADTQYQDLLNHLENDLDRMTQKLAEMDKEISVLEQKKEADKKLNSDEAKLLLEFQKLAGEYLAAIEYDILVMQHVGSSASQGLKELAKKLSGFVESIVGVTRDREGKLKSRLAFNERFQNSKERQLQKICGRIAEMYSQSGRSLSALPEIGEANGKVYCQAAQDCANVDLTNFIGGSEGRKKLAECSGFTFDSAEFGSSQDNGESIAPVGEDIGSILEQNSYNDLLKLRDLHFVAERAKYKAIYGTEAASTAMLDKVLHEVAKDLYNPTLTSQVYDPKGTQTKTHYSVLRKVYQVLWAFMDEQKGFCPAPENPGE